MQTAWLVDSSIYVFRSWFVGDQSIIDQDGNPIHAIKGFLDFVYQLLTQERVETIAFAFDESLKHSHRHKIYPEYKANRSPAPDNLKYQFQYCRQFLRAAGFSEYASSSYEADDLIGTWAQQLRQQGFRINIITGDKDLTQLIQQDDWWWEYGHNQKLDTKAITKKFRVRPDQIRDQLAIAGDKVDNIPGVPGIGMATAAKLLRRFDNIDKLLENLSDISQMKVRGAKPLQDLITEHQDTIRLSRQLTTIECQADIPSVTQLTTDINHDKLAQLFLTLNFSPNERNNWQALLENRTQFVT